MKRAIFRSHGNPADVIEIIEEDDPLPGPGEVRVRNTVMTINPAAMVPNR
jgi:trans-2-enoyl-CoA reductase